MPNLKQERAALLESCNRIVENAKSAGRELTDAEVSVINARLDDVKAVDDRIVKAKDNAELLSRLGSLPGGTGDGKSYLTGLTASGIPGVARQLAQKMRGDGIERKDLAPTGTVVGDIGLSPVSVVELGRLPSSLLDLLLTASVSTTYAYLRQTTRTNNAAPVAPGGLKPTSIYGTQRIEDHLRVIAHLSEPVDRFWISSDSDALASWLSAELLYGLAQALEDQIVNGDGTGENLTGLLNTSGIQVQPALADPLATTRAALTLLDISGASVTPFYVLSPSDWETIETSKDANGSYQVASAPVDRAQRRLWGCPVVTSTALEVGTGLAVASDAARIVTDSQGAQVDWGTPGDTFTRNQIVARAEMRANVQVLKPFGVVEIGLLVAGP